MFLPSMEKVRCYTVNKIEARNKFLSNLENNFSKIEGTFNFDIASAYGIEAEAIYKLLEFWVKQTFIDTATEDEFIDYHAMLFGVTRKQGTKATGEILITGKPGTTTPAGTIVLKTDGTKYQLLYDTTILSNEKAIAVVECLQRGEIGNCAIGEIANFEIANANIFTVINEKSFTNGYEKEPNDVLISRAKERILKPAHSGNIYDYEKWAKEVDGVGRVLVEPLWNGNGTVKVRIANYKNGVANEDLIQKVKERIEADNGRPVGANVTVVSFDNKDIEITVGVILSRGVKLSNISDLIISKIKQQIKDNSAIYTLNNQEILSINRVEKIILSVDGVEDCKVLINNDTKNIIVDSNEILTITGVVVNEQ